MITNQFSLGGSHGTYPIFDFSLEDNYDRSSSLVIKTDINMVDSLSNETFMQFYYLDNLLFEGIPMYGKESGDVFELTLYDKIAALWTAGGFALSGGSGEATYNEMQIYSIVKDILNGSQFLVSPDTVPSSYVSISTEWQTKPDFLFNIAKQVADEFGNICTVWVDKKNYVHIGALNADKTVDLSTSIVSTSDREMNFMRFGGSIVKGSDNILETSMTSKSYSDYHFDNKSIDNYVAYYGMGSQYSKVAFEKSGNHTNIKLGFIKDPTQQIQSWWGEPRINDLRKGYYYSNEILLRDKNNFYEIDEIDVAYKIWQSRDTGIDSWLPTSYFSQSTNEYPKVSGPPYGYLKSISVGFMDDKGNPYFDITMEKYAAGIYVYNPALNSTFPYSISDIGQYRFYVNIGNYNKSVKYPNPSAGSVTPYEPTPFVIPYWKNRNYAFNFRFKSRSDGWEIKCYMANNGVVGPSSSPWYALTDSCNQYVANMSDWHYNPKDWDITNTTTPWVNGATGPANGYPPAPINGECLFTNKVDLSKFPDGSAADAINGGGYPFIRAKLQTNVEKSLYDDAWYISQIYDADSKIPFVVGKPKRSVQHTPYLFYSDASIKNQFQAKALARNIYNDYQKVVNADIDIDPMAFYYPDSDKQFKVGWNVHLESPSSIVGDYRIRSITATPDRVTISLKNRSLSISDIIDKIQKQIKDVT